MNRTANMVQPRLRELAPLLGPLAAIESVRSAPVGPVAFGHAKLVHVMAGQSRIVTPTGEHLLTTGDVLVLGAGVWYSAVPAPRVRTWTIYLDQEFLRSHMMWALPEPDRVRPGFHPAGWDGRALVFRAGRERLARLEPLLRRMSVIPQRGGAAAVAALMSLFAQTAEHIVPVLVLGSNPPHPMTLIPAGKLTGPIPAAEAQRAARLLRAGLAHPWTMDELARTVAMSKSQLTRQFTTAFGVAPMRWLAETRLTEFARLLEETALPVVVAARTVGWQDRRIAAAWFRRRYGVSPLQFRRLP